jgi:uncharacterized caspase-like protein
MYHDQRRAAGCQAGRSIDLVLISEAKAMDLIERLREIDEPEIPDSPATSKTPIDRQIAVVVGIDTYPAGLPALENAARDAQSLAEVLHGDYGFALWPDGRPLLDAAATGEAVRRAIGESLAQATATTRWLFYFAGHGLVLDQHRGYLLLGDTRRDDPGQGLLIRDLLAWCLDSRCGEVLIVLDACYSGQALIQPGDLSDRFSEQPDDRICQIITSGNPDQPVLDGGSAGHSVFTQALLDALEGWAGIHEPDGSLRFIPLLDHLVLEVPRRLRALGPGNLFQQPVGGSLRGHRQMRSVTLQPLARRLDPVSVRDARSERPARRIHALEQIAAVGPELRQAAINLAIRHLQRTEIVPARLLLGWAERFEPDAEVRARAARALGTLGDPAALAVLVAALDDAAPVRRAAAAALGALGDECAAPALLREAQHAPESEFLDLSRAVAALGADTATIELLHIALRRGNLVPFLGPNLPVTWSGRLDRESLALALAQHAGIPATRSLAEAAAGSSAGTHSRYMFTRFLKDHFEQARQSKTPFQETLARLGCRLWLAWNYDPYWNAALGIGASVSGQDALYVRSEEPAIVYLSGTTMQVEHMVVLAQDYVRLREQEADRAAIIAFVQQQLRGKIVLFLGHNPHDPDFALLVHDLLDDHLKQVQVQPILVSETQAFAWRWGNAAIVPLRADALQLVERLGERMVQ